MLALGAAFATLTLAWLSLYAVAVARAKTVLVRTRVRRTLDALAGVVLLAFGVRLATEG
jgi:threonine/homoserine/homoserine lactone efflux protein